MLRYKSKIVGKKNVLGKHKLKQINVCLKTNKYVENIFNKYFNTFDLLVIESLTEVNAIQDRFLG